MAELSKASSWERSNIVEKGGFAVVPTDKISASDVARACADILTAPASKT